MASDSLIKAIHEMRAFTLTSIKGVTEPQFLTIPDSFNNHILWNIGHTLFDQCYELYHSSGVSLPVPEAYADRFRSGSSPREWAAQPDCSEVLEHFQALNDTIVSDYEQGAFSGFQPYELDDDTPVDTIEESILFDLMHQAMHAGSVLALRKLVETGS